MALARVHTTAADGTFSASGATAWNAAHGVTGADVGGIPYCPTATTEATSPNLTYTETSGPRLQVGTSADATMGMILGFEQSGYAAIWSAAVTPSITNFALQIKNDGNETIVNGGNNVYLANGAVIKVQIPVAAGRGPVITAGTATTDVQALSSTQTMNAAAVAFTGWKGVFTEGASGTAAGTSLIDLQYGTSGAESTQFKVSKTGLITTGGTAGVASFGPSIVTSITVKNGIITAIS